MAKIPHFYEYLIRPLIYNFSRIGAVADEAFAQLDSPLLSHSGEDPSELSSIGCWQAKVNGRAFLVKRLKSAVDSRNAHTVCKSSEIAHLAEQFTFQRHANLDNR